MLQLQCCSCKTFTILYSYDTLIKKRKRKSLPCAFPCLQLVGEEVPLHTHLGIWILSLYCLPFLPWPQGGLGGRRRKSPGMGLSLTWTPACGQTVLTSVGACTMDCVKFLFKERGPVKQKVCQQASALGNSLPLGLLLSRERHG